MARKKKWKMSEWMEEYRPYFVNTCGNSVEELMNGDTDPFINLPLSTLEACMKSQVAFLGRLKDNGMLPSICTGTYSRIEHDGESNG